MEGGAMGGLLRWAGRLRAVSPGLLLAFGGLALMGPAGVASASSPALAAAVELHDAARGGDEEARERAFEMLEALAEAEPRNARVLAYLGSIYGITARDSGNVVVKTRYTVRALRRLDEALELGPEDFVVRIVRASVQISLPRMFARKGDALEDMVVLDRLFRAEPEPTPAQASAMLPIYDTLAAEAPERGDWAAGRERAAGLVR